MTDVGTVIEHVGRHLVAKQVTAAKFVDACFCLVFSDAFAGVAISGLMTDYKDRYSSIDTNVVWY